MWNHLSRRLMFSEQTGAEGGGSTPASPAAQTPAAPPEAPAAAAPKPGDEAKFTQSDLDRIIAGRLSKYADYDQIKSELDTFKTASQTDLEREVNKARETTKAEVLTQANARLVAAEVRAAAAELGFRDPTDALAHLTAAGTLADVGVADDGAVDGAAVKAALDDLAKAKAYLLKDSGPQTPPPAAAGIGAAGQANPQVAPGLGRLQAAYAASPHNQ